jgi:hypothetical protein
MNQIAHDRTVEDSVVDDDGMEDGMDDDIEEDEGVRGAVTAGESVRVVDASTAEDRAESSGHKDDSVDGHHQDAQGGAAENRWTSPCV